MDLEMLKAISTQSHEQNVADSRKMAAFFRRIYEFPRPVIAAVNGPAIAGGCGIVSLCDFTLAVPGAKFGYTEARIGFMPALVSVYLVRMLGERAARELLLTGRIYDAGEAQRLGLVNEIVSAERLLPRAKELVGVFAENSPASLLATKRLMTTMPTADLDAALEQAVQENARIRTTADFREGITSFLEKRKPKWS
jgi:methylglutaconyl-CoA hydratase